MATIDPYNSNGIKKDRPEPENVVPLEHSVEDVTIIWLDQYMNEDDNREDVEKTKSLLRNINDYVLLFSKVEPCLAYIQSKTKEKIFLITTGSYAMDNLQQIHPLKQIYSVFIFCMNRDRYLPLMETYSKIIDIFTEQQTLIQSLTSNVELLTKQAAVFAVFDGKERPTRYLSAESASFLWFQLLTNVLKTITMTDTNNSGILEMLSYSQIYYRGNRPETNFIEEFRKTYKPADAIIWYSRQSFVYRLVNKALRTEDIDALYTFRVYITHLRDQIAREHEQLRLLTSSLGTKSMIIRLYRGLKMTNDEIHQMRDNIGGLISMNGFFSTSRDIEQAVRFATKPSQRTNVIGVLLEVEGDLASDRMVFADIAKYSVFPDEQEVLFDLATLFKVVHIEFDKGRNLWMIQLSSVEPSSYVVNEYINNVGKESEEKNSTLLFGRLMCDMGEYEKSERYLKRLLIDLPADHGDIPKIYFHLGRVCYFRGESKQAMDYYEQALFLQKKEIEPNIQSFDLAVTLHNLGNIYLEQKQTSKALEYYQNALTMKRAVLTHNAQHPSIAVTLSAIASVLKQEGNLRKALELYSQAYEMKKASLTVDHPSIADSLNNLGIVHQEMDNSEEALNCFRKSLQIKQKALPATHPSISTTLHNMGIIYRQEGDYNKAMICYTQALQIEQTTLSSDNLDIADTYNNLSTLYYDQMEYERALEMAQRKLRILQKHFQDDDEQVKSTKILINEIEEEIKTHCRTKETNNSPDEISF